MTVRPHVQIIELSNMEVAQHAYFVATLLATVARGGLSETDRLVALHDLGPWLSNGTSLKFLREIIEEKGL